MFDKAEYESVTDIANDPGLKNVDLSKEDLAKLFQELQISRSPLPSGWKQNRGFGLERILHQAMSAANLSPQPSYKPAGEQIDGAFQLDHRYFLFEAKWQEGFVNGPTVGGFQSKVNSKLVGTLGVFFSVTGFAEDIADYLTRGTPLTVILADGHDIAYGLREGMDKMLREKVQAASQSGIVYYQRETMQALLQPAGRVDPVKNAARERSIWVVTEGPWDARVIQTLSDRVKATYGAQLRTRTIPGYGVAQAFTVADAAARLSSDEDQVIILVDGDGMRHEEVQSRYAAGLDPKVSLVVADPNLESWFGIDPSRESRRTDIALADSLQTLDIPSLRAIRPDVDRFIGLLVGDEVDKDGSRLDRADVDVAGGDWEAHFAATSP